MLRSLFDILRGKRAGEPGQALPDLRPEDAPELELLQADLAELGALPVPAAARERTWAELRAHAREDEQRRAPLAAPWSRRALSTHRMATAAAAVILAAGVTTVGYVSLTGNEQGTTVASNSTPFTAVITGEQSTTSESGATLPPQSSSTEGSGATTSSQAVGETSTSESGTGGKPSTSSSLVFPTTQATQPASTATSSKPRTTTTAFVTTTTGPAPTTSDTLLTKRERERSAQAVAEHVARAVIAEDMEGAAQFVAGSGMSGLVLMDASLGQAYGYRVISVASLGADKARVQIEMWDRLPDGQGGYEERKLRFIFDVIVDGSGAIVAGIFAGGTG